jgi:NAD(P)-dependent dehydrogenase (short-subunit alcohol dehydrogenase family)
MNCWSSYYYHYLPTWRDSSSSGTTTPFTTLTTSTVAVVAGLSLYAWWSSSSSSPSPPQPPRQGQRRELNANTTATEVLQRYLPPQSAGSVEEEDKEKEHDDDDDERVYVFTGTTSGLGRHCALLLLSSTSTKKCHIITGARTKERAKEFQAEFQHELTLQAAAAAATAAAAAAQPGVTPATKSAMESKRHQLTVLVLDLSSLQSVHDFCNKVLALNVSLTAIVNNAGCYKTSGCTMDGYQTTWQTNCLAPALLTELLLPILHPTTGRVIYVSSELHKIGFFWPTTNDMTRFVERHCPPTSNGSSPFDYGFSKACQILHATYLQTVFEEDDQQNSSSSSRRVFAVDPGLVQTNIARHASPLAKWWDYSVAGFFLLRSVDQGAATILYCLLAPLEELDTSSSSSSSSSSGTKGSRNLYFVGCRPQMPRRACLDVQGAKALDQLFRKLWK